MCMMENDDDMRIVGAPEPEKSDFPPEWIAHTENGNIDRAHRLGANFAQQLLNIEDNDPSAKLQKQMLFAFAVHAGGLKLLPDAVIYDTVYSTFFSRLRTLLPDFEDTMRRLGTFTFYRMCATDNGDFPAQKVGEVFAALYGKADDVTVEKQGADLFLSYLVRLEETVGLVEFSAI